MSSSKFDYTRLAGDWWNELGSNMHLVPDGSGGLTGTYRSKVGGVPKDYALAGRFDINVDANGSVGVPIGWAVTYYFPSNPPIHSTATWSGQFFDNNDHNKQGILTHWLLTSSTTKAYLWNSTNLGTDSFTRKQPSQAEVEKSKAFAFASPHVENIVACYSSTNTDAS